MIDAHIVQSQLWGYLAALPNGVTMVSTAHSACKLEHNKSLKGRLYEKVLRLFACSGIKFFTVSDAVYICLLEAGMPANSEALVKGSRWFLTKW